MIVFDSATVKIADVESFAARVRVPVYVQCSRKVADVPRHLEELGQLVGKPATALAAQVRRSLRLPLRSNLIPVFIEISASPLYAVGPGSFVDELISLAGGQNVVREGGEFPQLSKEKLLALKPAVYVIATTPGQPVDTSCSLKCPRGANPRRPALPPHTTPRNGLTNAHDGIS